MSNEDQIAHHQKMLATYRRNLANFLNQQAGQGGSLHAPPNVFNGILESRKEIKRAKEVLAVLGATVEDYPDDEEYKPQDEGALGNKILTPSIAIDDFSYPNPLFFVGREEALDELQKAIQNSNTVVIGGMAGIGKTYLVAKIVDLLKEEYQVLWIDYASFNYSELILNRIAEFIEQKFGDPKLLDIMRSSQADQSRIIGLAATLLNKYKCLLVFDNFDTGETLPPLVVIFNQLSKDAKMLITVRELFDARKLLNPPYRLVLSRLTLSEGIELLRHYSLQLGLPDQNEEVLKQAYTKVDGHPYFLRLLIALSESFPLQDILLKLPQFTQEAQDYIQGEIFNHIDSESRILLQRLSLIRGAFLVSAVEYVYPEDGYRLFQLLLRKFLVERQAKDSSYYRIHDLIRDHGINLIYKDEISRIHSNIASYYQSKDENTFVDYQEWTNHLLEAGDIKAAQDVTDTLLGTSLHLGRFEYVIGYTEHILKDNTVSAWASVYFARGRALRFKERLGEALDAYRKASSFAEDEHMAGGAKVEIASMLIKLSKDRKDTRYKEARKIYREMLSEKDVTVRLLAMTGAAYLDMREGSTQKAISTLNKALVIAEKADLKRNVAEIYQGIGYCYDSTDTNKAIEFFEKARAMRENIQEIFGSQDVEAKYTLFDALASRYRKIMKFKEAAHYSGLCVEIDRELEVENRLAHSLFQLGRNFCLLGSYALSLNALKESLSLVEHHNIEVHHKLLVLEWIVVSLWYLERFESAIERVLEFVFLAEEEDEEGIARHITIEEQSLKQKPDLPMVIANGQVVHFLILPKRFPLSIVHEWSMNVIKRRPDLAKAYYPMLFSR